MRGLSQQAGVVLFYALVILALLALLILSEMQGVLVYQKNLGRHLEQQELLSLLESEANRLVTNSLMHQDCVRSEQSPNWAIQQLKEGKGCSLSRGAQSLLYVIEELEADPCLQVTMDQVSYGTQHRRVSLLAAGEKPVVLQIRVARAIPPLVCDELKVTQIQIGVVSWRYL